MDQNLENLFQKYLAILDAQNFDEHYIDYTHLEKHLSFLRQLAVVENSSAAVMDVYKRQYVFMQSKFLAVLGLELEDVMRRGPRAIYEIMYPPDIPHVLETLYRGSGFLIALPAGEKKDFKLIYDFRLKSIDGTYVRFLQQIVPLELDGKGNIWLMLLINDLIPNKPDPVPLQRRLVNLKTGKLYVFLDEENTGRSILTKREIEILGLLSKGMASKQVAGELFLSVNTVNNHRRNILEKTNTENTAEALKYAMSLGLV